MKRINKLLISSVLATSLTMGSLSVYAASFDDVYGLESEESISKIASLKLMSGDGSYFNPEDTMTRQEFTAVMNKILDLGPAKPVQIKDVDTKNGKNSWVVKMVNIGALSLNSKGQFQPKKEVTYLELSKALAYGLGFKASWTNDPAHYLFYLDRKGILDIDTDLDALVSREAVAVAVDKYITQKNLYDTDSGVVTSVTEKGFTLNNGTDNVRYTYAGNVSVFVSDMSETPESISVGSPVEVILNKSGRVAFVSSKLLDAEEGTIELVEGQWKINSNLIKNVNLNAVVESLPTDQDTQFTLALFGNYRDAGAQFSGQVFFTADNDVTMVAPYISKAENKALTLGVDTVKVAFGNLTQSFTIGEETKVTVAGKESTFTALKALQDAGNKVTGTIEANANGQIVSIVAEAKK